MSELPLQTMRALYLAIAFMLVACGDAPPQVSQISGEDKPLTMRLSPALDRVLLGSVHNGASLWRLEDRQILATLNHQTTEPSDVVAAAFSPDGTHAVTATRQTVVLWDLARKRSLGYWGTPGLVRSVDISWSGQQVLVGLSTREAWLIDVLNGAVPSVIPHADAVGVVRFSPDAKWAVTGADDGMMRVWDLAKGESLLTWRFPAPMAAAAFSEDQSMLFAAPFHGPGRLWRLKDGQVLHDTVGERRVSLSQARFSTDGRRLVTGSPSGEVRLWSVKTGAVLQKWQTPKPEWARPSAAGIMDIAISPDNRSVTAALTTGAVVTWRP